MSAGREVQSVPIGIPAICWKNLSRKKQENFVYQKLDHLDDVIFSVLTCFGSQTVPSQCLLVTQY